MSWYNPFSWSIGSPSDQYRNSLNQTAGAAKTNAGNAGSLAGTAASEWNVANANLGAQQNYLQGQLEGKNSVSAMQLQQALQQQQAQQQSMAAGANPANAAMAARNAAQNMGQAGTALAGQQAVAGLQERNQAAQQLAQLNMGQLNNASQTALGGYGAANQGYGNAMQGYGAAMGNPGMNAGSMIAGAGQGILGALSGKLFSDKRLKKNIVDDDADEVLKALKSYSYEYKDPSMGKGRQLGVMAQDLEKAGLNQAVIDTPRGKMVDSAKLTGANTAMLASLARKIERMEKGK